MVDPKIIELFSYSQDEQNTSPYLHDYMNRISPKLPLILEDPDTLERFMLAGLFLTYRAFNHMGATFTTDDKILDLFGDSIHARRLRTFKQVTGKDITSTGHYLRLVGFGRVILFMFFPDLEGYCITLWCGRDCFLLLFCQSADEILLVRGDKSDYVRSVRLCLWR